MTGHRLTAAGAASLAFNPSLWTGGFVVFLALHFEPTTGDRWIAAAVAFASLAVIPISILFLLRAGGRLSDLEMRIQPERGLVYRTCAVFYALGAAALFLLGATWQVWGLVALHVPYALVLEGCNRRWKLSIHTTGLAGMVGAAVLFFGFRGLPLAVVPVLGGWARWKVRAHTIGQLVAGATIGVLLTTGGLALIHLLVAS